MNLYLEQPVFATKDLDVLVSGMTIRKIECLCDRLSPLSPGRKPCYTYQNPEHEGRSNPVFSIYFTKQDGKSFAIELFLTYNGRDLRELTPFVNYVRRWDKEFQTLSIEGIIVTRLEFRPPDRISSVNAHKLNGFVESVRGQSEWKGVEAFAKDFQLEETINDNPRDLRQRKLKIIGSGKLSFLSQR